MDFSAQVSRNRRFQLAKVRFILATRRSLLFQSPQPSTGNPRIAPVADRAYGPSRNVALFLVGRRVVWDGVGGSAAPLTAAGRRNLRLADARRDRQARQRGMETASACRSCSIRRSLCRRGGWAIRKATQASLKCFCLVRFVHSLPHQQGVSIKNRAVSGHRGRDGNHWLGSNARREPRSHARTKRFPARFRRSRCRRRFPAADRPFVIGADKVRVWTCPRWLPRSALVVIADFLESIDGFMRRIVNPAQHPVTPKCGRFSGVVPLFGTLCLHK